MGFFDWLSFLTNKPKKEEKEPKFVIPDTFEIKPTILNKYDFMTTGKTYTSPEELRLHGDEIDKEIHEYEQTSFYKILSSDLEDLDIKSFIVNKPPYTEGDLDLLILTGNEFYNWFKRFIYSPSLGYGISMTLNRDYPLPFDQFIKQVITTYTTWSSILYKKGESLEITYKISGLNIHEDNSNKEITFIDNVEKRNVSTVREYIEKEEIKEYELELIDDDSSKILVYDLSLTDEEFSIIKDYYQNIDLDRFYEQSSELYKRLNSRITSISVMYGKLLIKGNDKLEKKIYTTLNVEELPPGLRKLVSGKVRSRN